MAVIPSRAQDVSYSGWTIDGKGFVEVLVRNGKIERIEKKDPGSPNSPKIYIAPGLIDTQVNGYTSISFSEEGLTPEKIRKVTVDLFKEGVTTYFPTIITGPADLTKKNLAILSEALKHDDLLSLVIPGIFLEGPYISPDEGFRGVHSKQYIRPPDWDEFSTFIKASGNKIIQVGLAPETTGAIDFIRKATASGIMVSLAHHNADAATIQQAINAGAKVSTHLGNGCANMINRHNNPLWPQLASDALTASIIGDGHHLTPEELTVFYKAKGPDHLMLVSDATELAGMPPGEYDWNGKKVVMTEDGALLYPEDNVLAGASFPVRTGVMNMQRLAGCSLEEAMNLATVNPARVYGLKDRGVLSPGRRADLILFSTEGNEMIIRQTIVSGNTVYKRD